jgi:hypothetical protein
LPAFAACCSVLPGFSGRPAFRGVPVLAGPTAFPGRAPLLAPAGVPGDCCLRALDCFGAGVGGVFLAPVLLLAGCFGPDGRAARRTGCFFAVALPALACFAGTFFAGAFFARVFCAGVFFGVAFLVVAFFAVVALAAFAAAPVADFLVEAVRLPAVFPEDAFFALAAGARAAPRRWSLAALAISSPLFGGRRPEGVRRREGAGL